MYSSWLFSYKYLYEWPLVIITLCTFQVSIDDRFHCIFAVVSFSDGVIFYKCTFLFQQRWSVSMPFLWCMASCCWWSHSYLHRNLHPCKVSMKTKTTSIKHILLYGPTPFMYSCCMAPLPSYTLVVWPHSPHVLLLFGPTPLMYSCCMTPLPSCTLAVWPHSPHVLLLYGPTPLMYSCCMAPLPLCTDVWIHLTHVFLHILLGITPPPPNWILTPNPWMGWGLMK